MRAGERLALAGRELMVDHREWHAVDLNLMPLRMSVVRIAMRECR
jgi:hypothetical protein